MIDLGRKRGTASYSSPRKCQNCLGVADRILVMSNGRLAGIVEAAKTSQEEILRLAATYI